MSDPVVDDAYAFLRAHTTGDLRFDEHLRPIKYVIAPDGLLIAPAMTAMLQTLDTVLFVPEGVDGSMELQVTMQQFGDQGADGALADRWRIHHGEPDDVNWARLTIDAARYEGYVLDGESLTRTNPLASDEPRLCRMVNAGHATDLRCLAAERANINIDSAVMVAIDPLGIDVRGQLDVIRIPATEPMPDSATAERVLKEMIAP